MDDLIFRSAAIEAIYEAFPECRNLGMAASALEDVPPAQRWIPEIEALAGINGDAKKLGTFIVEDKETTG